MSVKFREGTVEEMYDRVAETFDSNVHESGFEPLRDRLMPDRAKYEKMFELGIMRVFVAEDGPDLVGYCVMILADHHHYVGTLWATQDVIYIKPKYRGLTSIKFLNWIDEMLFADGVMVVSRSVSVHRDYSRVLERMGYGEIETVYYRSRGK